MEICIKYFCLPSLSHQILRYLHTYGEHPKNLLLNDLSNQNVLVTFLLPWYNTLKKGHIREKRGFCLLRLQSDAVRPDMEGMATEDETGTKREVEVGTGSKTQSRLPSGKSLPSVGTITSQVPLTSRGSRIQTKHVSLLGWFTFKLQHA